MSNSTVANIMHGLIETVPDPVLVSNRAGEIIAANSRAASLCSCQAERLVGLPVDELIFNVSVDASSTAIDDPIAAVLVSPDGARVPVRRHTTAIENGEVLVTVLRLVTGATHSSVDDGTHVLETLAEGVIISSSSGEIVYLNQAARNMMECQNDGMPSSNVRELFRQPSASDLNGPIPDFSLDDALTGHSSASSVPAILRCLSTTSLEVSVNATPLAVGADQPSGAIISFLDVTRQKHAELQISIQKHVLDAIAQGGSLEDTGNMLAGYLERVIPGTHVAIYQVERDSSQISQIAAPTLPDEISFALSETAEDPVSAMCVSALISRRPFVIADVAEESDTLPAGMSTLMSGSGIRSVWCFPVSASAHRSIGIISLYREVAGVPDEDVRLLIDTAAGLLRVALDRVQIEQELRYQSFNDDLTGLPNRVLLMDRLEIALQRSARSDDQVALLLLDIDKFQMINNSLGHHAGDEMLRESARRLRNCVRADDLVARFTGDTFGILLEQITSDADAINVVMRIQRAFATPLKITDVDVYCSVSIGIATATEPDASSDTLVRYSDIALNRAKEVGRGQFAIFSPAQDLSRVPKIELQSRLHRALAADALELYFQPVMSLRGRGIAGYEALVRWTDEQFGVVSPDEFLPLAQQAGIMSEITSWVLDRAVSQLCEWRQAIGTTLFAAVNISPSEMNDSLLVEQVDAVLKRYQVDPGCLILEMTEHALLDTAGQPREILDRLRSLGVKIALDDFGTGYSSLSYLEQLAVDLIKIDRAFIQAARGGASRAPVATAMVDLARKLGMASVAEGIETEEDERVARQLGCDYSQGYLYGRPQPGDNILAIPPFSPRTE